MDWYECITKIKDRIIAKTRNELQELEKDSLKILRKKSDYVFNSSADILPINDSFFIAFGSYQLDKNNPDIDIAVLKYNFYNFKSTKEIFSMGKKDTIELPAYGTKISTYYKNSIFLAGASVISTGPPTLPNWINLANLDNNLKPNWQKYIGGDYYYFVAGVLATKDGGCLVYGVRHDVDLKYAESYLLKLNAQGQLVSSDGVIQPNSEIKIFPNPSHNIINISLAKLNELYNLQCIDSQGKIVYSCEVQNYCSFDVSQWQSGIYAFSIRDKKGNLVKTEKVVVE